LVLTHLVAILVAFSYLKSISGNTFFIKLYPSFKALFSLLQIYPLHWLVLFMALFKIVSRPLFVKKYFFLLSVVFLSVLFVTLIRLPDGTEYKTAHLMTLAMSPLVVILFSKYFRQFIKPITRLVFFLAVINLVFLTTAYFFTQWAQPKNWSLFSFVHHPIDNLSNPLRIDETRFELDSFDLRTNFYPAKNRQVFEYLKRESEPQDIIVTANDHLFDLRTGFLSQRRVWVADCPPHTDGYLAFQQRLDFLEDLSPDSLHRIKSEFPDNNIFIVTDQLLSSPDLFYQAGDVYIYKL